MLGNTPSNNGHLRIVFCSILQSSARLMLSQNFLTPKLKKMAIQLHGFGEQGYSLPLCAILSILLLSFQNLFRVWNGNKRTRLNALRW